MAHMIPQEPRNRRVNLRATPYQEQLIRAGASRRGENLSDFILEGACTKAEEAISDQVHVIATEAQWKAFTKVIEKLGTSHDASGFECGVESMTAWIERYALTSKQSEITQAYVLHRRDDNQIIGYYALSAGDVTAKTAELV